MCYEGHAVWWMGYDVFIIIALSTSRGGHGGLSDEVCANKHIIVRAHDHGICITYG